METFFEMVMGATISAPVHTYTEKQIELDAWYQSCDVQTAAELAVTNFQNNL